jgi:hypothetical protein
MAVTNRKYIEKLIYDTFDALDPSGVNRERYHTLFSEMKDNEFEKFMKDFLSDDEENFILNIIEFENTLKFEYCEAAAKVLNIPLMEYIYLPHLSMDKSNVIISKEKCLVGYLNIKRTQQLLHKKNSLSTSDERRSLATGQVTNEDKNARDSDVEASMLVALGADKILQELHGPRADDPEKRNQLKQHIATKGHAMLEELEGDTTSKTTLNTVATYLLCMGLFNDLITPTYLLPSTTTEIFD